MGDAIIGRRIALALEINGMSQRDLARAIGVFPSVVCKWCAGGISPSAASIKAIALALDVSADFLLDITLGAEAKALIEQQKRLKAWEDWAAAMPNKQEVFGNGH